MTEFLAQNWTQLAWLTAIAFVLYKVHEKLRRARRLSPERFSMTVYCRHCNWEGTVLRANMACHSCGSPNVSVLAV